jgi:hypothetical protein
MRPRCNDVQRGAMSIAVEFSEQLEAALAALAHDEWAVVRLRERIVQGVDPATAFASVVDLVNLARVQTDACALESCFWVAAALAELSAAKERPRGLAEAIQQALAGLIPGGTEAAVNRVAIWYRIRALADSG